jgi:hypothetical protein
VRGTRRGDFSWVCTWRRPKRFERPRRA